MNFNKLVMDYEQKSNALMEEGRQLHRQTVELLKQIATEEEEQSAHWQRVEEKLDILLENKGRTA